jgi:hypothetical protein
VTFKTEIVLRIQEACPVNLYECCISFVCMYDKNIVESGTYGYVKSQVKRGLFYDNYGQRDFQWKENGSGTRIFICAFVCYSEVIKGLYSIGKCVTSS